MDFAKSKGTTPSEQLLAEMAETTFLRLWSYPNVFRDQGISSPAGDGKEICDLLVVSGTDLILFSDKSCEMSDSSDLDLAWGRWYDRAIKKSAQQIFGAERWLRKFPDRVFVDRACQQRLPFALPESNSWRVHRVVVAIGARDRCATEFGGSGSLTMRPSVVGKDHVARVARDGVREHAPDYRPFEVGWIDADRGYVHVLDEFALSTLLGELDTVTDFVDYLAAKEIFIRSGKLEFAAGEEELLWEYLRKGDTTGFRRFPTEQEGRLSISKGNWERWTAHSAYGSAREADEGSRAVWDRLINSLSRMRRLTRNLRWSLNSFQVNLDAVRGFSSC